MPENFIAHCNAALSNLIASHSVHSVQTASDPYTEFSEGVKNFVAHYCKAAIVLNGVITILWYN